MLGGERRWESAAGLPRNELHRLCGRLSTVARTAGGRCPDPVPLLTSPAIVTSPCSIPTGVKCNTSLSDSVVVRIKAVPADDC